MRLLKSSLMRILGAFASISLVACGVTTSGGGDDGSQGTPENPVPQKTGPYLVTNHVDFSVEQVLPPQVELVVKTLRDFSTNPAHTLITLADEAGVPAVGTLYGLLPSVLKDKLEGWINDEIAKVKIAGKPITEYAGQLAMLADFALTSFDVDSELVIHDATATHKLTALDLSPTGFHFKLALPGLASDILTQEPDVYVAEGGALSLGEQHFGLNYGEYAWQGIELISTQVFGADVRTALGNAINCPNLAHNVAGKCVLGVCVGHEAELTSICNGGLDYLVQQAHDRLAALRVEALHLASGQAKLVDDDGDGVGDRIVDGAWNAEMNIGLGLRHAPATFEATR